MPEIKTVALLGPNGNVGSHTLKYLLPLEKDNKIKLVLLLKTGDKLTAVDSVPNSVEVKEFDLENGSLEDVVEVVEGVEFFMCVLS